MAITSGGELPFKPDFHIHTTVSDGTDTPADLLKKVKEAGITHFSVTDHDDIKGCRLMRTFLKSGDPSFVVGAEFSCRDEGGRYHILGYGFDLDAAPINALVAKCHELRLIKFERRMRYLEETCGFLIPDAERQELLALDNPGKPHLGQMLVRLGYAKTKESAIRDLIDKTPRGDECVRPETVIEAILESGGLPVLAHPSFGSGSQMITGDAMDRRLKSLTARGLRGVEAFYSGFSKDLTEELLRFAARYGICVTAGSDYHGANKTIGLGDTGFAGDPAIREAQLRRFLDEIERVRH